MSENIILSLGGSLIAPEEIDVAFLRKFRHLILKHINKGKKFVIVTGGGKICRKYQNAARAVVKLEKEDVDWLGIHSTRLNAHLIRTIFRKEAHPKVIKNPIEKVDFKEKVLIASGWKPGSSTDCVAVLLAKNLGAKKIINLTNVDYVYDKDPKIKGAKIIKEIKWKDFIKIIGTKWDPGLNAPFDPVASQEAKKDRMTVVIVNGKNIENLEKVLSGDEFDGTVIKS